MNRKLRSTFELAQERVIAPTWKPIQEEDVYHESSEIPEFVTDWSYPGSESSEGLEDDDGIVFVDKIDDKNEDAFGENALQELNMTEVNMQQPERINYGEIPQVHWYGDFTSYTGFGRTNRAFAFGLSDKNVAVKPDMIEGRDEVNEATVRMLNKLANNRIKESAPKVFSCITPLNMFHGGRKILYTMMETTGSLHEHFVGKLNLFDEIWVPTENGKELFKANGVNPPIGVFPLGVDTDRYRPGIKPFNIPELNDFVFISVFKWGYRKAPDILLRAYLEEFSAQDDVSLLLICRATNNNNDDIITSDFQLFRNQVQKSDDQLPHVMLYNRPIKEWQMPHIYAVGDAFVLPSRGEGMCFTYLEAACCGLPVIGSYCTAQMDYLTEENSYLVHPNIITTSKVTGPLSQLSKQCMYYENQGFADFDSRGVDELKAHMRSVVNDYQTAIKKAALLRNEVIRRYNWNTVIDKVYKRILEIQ